MPRAFSFFLIISFAFSTGGVKALKQTYRMIEEQPISFSLDGVSLRIYSPELVGASIITPPPGNHIQIASAYNLPPSIIEFTISASPLRNESGVGLLPDSTSESDEASLCSPLSQVSGKVEGLPKIGPTATLFGSRVKSKVCTISLPGVEVDRVATLTEWLIVSGNRFWIIRIAEQNTSSRMTMPSMASYLTLSSNNLSTPSSSLAPDNIDRSQNAKPSNSQSPSGSVNLSTPSWWIGPCDTFNYYNKTGNKYYAYPLGASYRNVQACGPSPSIGEGPDVLVTFFPGAWGELEWECVELVMRYIYLAYGVVPYHANGNQVVENYAGSVFTKIINGTQGKFPVAGDILSYCATCNSGHTAVVMDSMVNGNGMGTVTVLEENNSPNGSSTLLVNNWLVLGNAGPVIGWLHPTNSSLSNGYSSYFPTIHN